MRDKDRIYSVLKLLNTLDNSSKTASKIVNSFFRSNKLIGSKDRKFISNSFWNIIRHRNKIKWHIEYLGLRSSNTKELTLELFFLNDNYKNNIIKIKNLLILISQDYEDFKQINLDFLDGVVFKNFHHPKMPDHIKYEIQEFILNSIKVSFPDQWQDVALSINKEAFFDIRVNRIKNISRDQLSMKLKDLGIDHKYSQYSPLGIRFSKRYPIEGHELYKNGYLEIQGEASQIASILTDAKPGLQIAEICSGAGGKSLILADLMMNKGRILSFDTNKKRLQNAGIRLKRAGVHNVERRHVDKNWSVNGFEKIFDLVLIDAPCSGIGKWSRSPDSKFSFDKKKLDELVEIQYQLLVKGALMVKPGGKLAYMVCSFLPEEGLNQVEKFKKKNNLDFSEINLMNMWNDTILSMNEISYPFETNKNSIVLNPAIHGTDGFYISMFQRKR
jgi:16S rRNA (cytosine967-C5)-methyltransferase